MKLTFKNLLGVVTCGVRSVGEIVAVGVAVKKEELTNLSTSNKLKLAKAARERGGEGQIHLLQIRQKSRGMFLYNL